MATLPVLTEHLGAPLISGCVFFRKEHIKSVRLDNGSPKKDHILYLSATKNKADTLCRTAGGSSFLYHGKIETALNHIMETLEYYADWEEEMWESVRQGCTLTELLDLAYPVITHPMMILDQNEWLIAYNSVLDSMSPANKNISDLINTGTSAPEKIASFNQAFHDCFKKKDVYQIPGSLFTRNGYALNLFHGQALRGIMLLEGFDNTVTQGKLDLFFLLGQIIQQMMNNPSTGVLVNSDSTSLTTYLELANIETEERLRRSLQINGWKRQDNKQLIYIAPAASSSLSPNLAHSLFLFNRLLGLIAAEYKNGIILFLNMRILEECQGYQLILHRIHQLSYCAGISPDFQEVTMLPVMARRAFAALEYGVQKPGILNHFEDCFLKYFFSVNRVGGI